MIRIRSRLHRDGLGAATDPIEVGRMGLKRYYLSIPSSEKPFPTYQQLEDYLAYDQYLLSLNSNDKQETDFLNTFGKQISDAGGILKANPFLDKLAKATKKGKVPTSQTFTTCLINSTKPYSWSNISGSAKNLAKAVKEGVKETATTVATVASAGIGIYLLVISGGFLGMLALNKILANLKGKVA